MESGIVPHLMKYRLPDRSTVDISSDVMDYMQKWRQVKPYMAEAGGFLIGYQNRISSNIIVDGLSHPYDLDYRNIIRFDIKDERHHLFLLEQEKYGSHYVGTWHTHPEEIPYPSSRDLLDWNASLREDKSFCKWMFFIIVGIRSMRIWAGDSDRNEITELPECNKSNGIYVD